MKRIFTALGVVIVGGALGLPLLAQDTPANRRPVYGPNDRPVALPVPHDVVEGEAYFLERIGIPADSKLFVSLVGRVAGAEYLPLASTITPARGGSTSFRLLVPQGLAPRGPYRLQAWLVADNRLLMSGANPSTTINSFSERPRIRLRMQGAPQNIDGIGDGKPLPQEAPRDIDGIGDGKPLVNQTAPSASSASAPYFVRGVVEKLDRRALATDAQIEVMVSDISLADAPARVIGTQRFSINGKQLPVPFAVPIQAGAINERNRYSLSVRISEAGKLTYITDTVVPVTPKNVRTAFQIPVVAVSRR